MRNLNTKEARENLLKYEFEQLEKRGFKKEIYKDVTIWTGFEGGKYFLKVFKGTATKPLYFYTFRQESYFNEYIQKAKTTADNIDRWKTERKKETGFLTGAAACSAAIKAELKNLFPHIRFSVTSSTFSMGDSVDVSWIDAVSAKEIETIISKYQRGYFDGMQDMYIYSNDSNLPQSKYVRANRRQSEETRAKLIEILTPVYDFCDYGCLDVENMAYRVFYQTSFPKNAIIKGIEKTGETSGLNDVNVFYRVAFENTEPEPEKELINWDTIFNDPEKMEIIKTKHTQKGFDLWVVKLVNRVSKDEFNNLLTTAKTLGGWYSSFSSGGAVPGFQFKTEQGAQNFAGQKVETTERTEKTIKEPAKNDFNEKQAAKWAKLSEAYQKECDKKRSELEHASTNTPKKNREYNSKRVDADILEDAANMAAGLSELYKSENVDTLLNYLQPIKSKSHLMPFIAGHDSNGYYDSHRANQSSFEKYGVRMIGIDGITTQEQAQKVFNLLHNLNKIDPKEQAEKERKNRIKELEDKFKFQKIAGFFPTPPELVEEMVSNLKITNGQTILEPSAGLGNIAESVRLAHPNNKLKTIEINGCLSEILELKGFDCSNDDFLTVIGKYDRIIMNPPFENGQDIDHVRHAYNLLNENGRIVSIMGAGAFQNSTKKFKEFQTWIDEVGADYNKLPEKSFKDAFKSTNVNTYLVIIDK